MHRVLKSMHTGNRHRPMMARRYWRIRYENHDRLGRRVFNTRLRWDMLPKRCEVDGCTPQNDDKKGNDDVNTGPADDNDSHVHKQRPQCGKFIYVTRNQIDVVASFYHHLSNQIEGTYTDSFETFLRDWMDGKIPFGSSLHHLIRFAGGFADNLYDTSCGHDDILRRG
eukprot:CAMPEP_0113389532 /NCGR_PEP_ID=MMETSP0013_2-20120614/9677_1 /TAXON_ID=2843 ORGANISM="Skeletonema costatum, Strain 1716" /NCGR_SAMPLE_ID=MMETSP0013_2 /ASSEMBLY_ACC=CAM_ASM_000158 /LENGTH=167 /DNA_ID=CAMNT_0000272615 /DNA_START=208 /DNA_END=711 /DNA_ORIENTATION=+ /assembly_acc=CAM_ASM_000158